MPEIGLDEIRRESLRKIAGHLRMIADSSKALIDARWTLQAETAGNIERGPDFAEVKLTGRCRAKLEIEWDEADPNARKPDERPRVTVEHLGRRNEFRLSEAQVEIKPAFPLLHASAGGPTGLMIQGIIDDSIPKKD